MLTKLEQYIDTQWPQGNDKKEDICRGLRHVLEMISDSRKIIVPFVSRRKVPISDDIISVLEIVQ